MIGSCAPWREGIRLKEFGFDFNEEKMTVDKEKVW